MTKFTGYWKGTDKRPPGKHMVGSMEEEIDTIDTVTMDVPLLLRIMEYAREDAKTDQDLHHVAEKMVRLSKNKSLSMNDYDSIVSIGIKEQINLAKKALLENNLDLAEYYINNIKRKKIIEDKLEGTEGKGGWIDTSKDNAIYPLGNGFGLHIDVARDHGIKMRYAEDYVPAFNEGWVRFYITGGSLELSGYIRDLKKSFAVWGPTAKNKLRAMGSVFMDLYRENDDSVDDHKIFSEPKDFIQISKLMGKNLAEAKKKMSPKDDPCWKGYHMVGTKMKKGREVPNCVPGKKGT